MDTQTRDIENFMNVAQDSLEEFRKLHIDNLSRISELQMEFINLCAECNKAQLDRLAKAKSPSDILATESGIATEYSTKFFENARQIFEAANQMQNNMLSWMTENNFTQEFEKLVSTSESGSKQTARAKPKNDAKAG
jgi:phasin family protein